MLQTWACSRLYGRDLFVNHSLIWVGQCECGQTTFAASGEPKAVEAFFFALSQNGELALGSQSQDGTQHEKA